MSITETAVSAKGNCAPLVHSREIECTEFALLCRIIRCLHHTVRQHFAIMKNKAFSASAAPRFWHFRGPVLGGDAESIVVGEGALGCVLFPIRRRRHSRWVSACGTFVIKCTHCDTIFRCIARLHPHADFKDSDVNQCPQK